MARRTRVTARDLDRLDDRERSAVLANLLHAHPELLAEANETAGRLLATVDPAAVAEDVQWTLTNLDPDELANRAGRHRGGYVEANEAAWAIVEEAFEPFLVDLRRLAELGYVDAATATARGAMDGLDLLGDPGHGSVLAWAGPDTPEHLADTLRLVAGTLGIPVEGDE